MRGLNEIVPIQDVFASGLGAIERLDGGLYRLWFYVLQTEDDRKEKIVVAKVVTPATDAVMRLAASINAQAGADLAPRMADLAN